MEKKTEPEKKKKSWYLIQHLLVQIHHVLTALQHMLI